jgi:hypothetical protein
MIHRLQLIVQLEVETAQPFDATGEGVRRRVKDWLRTQGWVRRAELVYLPPLLPSHASEAETLPDVEDTHKR